MERSEARTSESSGASEEWDAWAEEAIETCVNVYFGNKGEASNFANVANDSARDREATGQPRSDTNFQLAMMLELSRSSDDQSEKWTVARKLLKQKLRALLKEAQKDRRTVWLESDYDAKGVLAECLRAAGLKTFMTVPCKTSVALDPIARTIQKH